MVMSGGSGWGISPALSTSRVAQMVSVHYGGPPRPTAAAGAGVKHTAWRRRRCITGSRSRRTTTGQERYTAAAAHHDLQSYATTSIWTTPCILFMMRRRARTYDGAPAPLMSMLRHCAPSQRPCTHVPPALWRSRTCRQEQRGGAALAVRRIVANIAPFGWRHLPAAGTTTPHLSPPKGDADHQVSGARCSSSASAVTTSEKEYKGEGHRLLTFSGDTTEAYSSIHRPATHLQATTDDVGETTRLQHHAGHEESMATVGVQDDGTLSLEAMLAMAEQQQQGLEATIDAAGSYHEASMAFRHSAHKTHFHHRAASSRRWSELRRRLLRATHLCAAPHHLEAAVSYFQQQQHLADPGMWLLMMRAYARFGEAERVEELLEELRAGDTAKAASVLLLADGQGQQPQQEHGGSATNASQGLSSPEPGAPFYHCLVEAWTVRAGLVVRDGLRGVVGCEKGRTFKGKQKSGRQHHHASSVPWVARAIVRLPPMAWTTATASNATEHKRRNGDMSTQSEQAVVDNVARVMSLMVERGVIPNVAIFQGLVDCYAVLHDHVRAEQVLLENIYLWPSVPRSVPLYLTLMRLARVRKDYSAGMDIFFYLQRDTGKLGGSSLVASSLAWRMLRRLAFHGTPSDSRADFVHRAEGNNMYLHIAKQCNSLYSAAALGVGSCSAQVKLDVAVALAMLSKFEQLWLSFQKADHGGGDCSNSLMMADLESLLQPVLCQADVMGAISMHSLINVDGVVVGAEEDYDDADSFVDTSGRALLRAYVGARVAQACYSTESNPQGPLSREHVDAWFLAGVIKIRNYALVRAIIEFVEKEHEELLRSDDAMERRRSKRLREGILCALAHIGDLDGIRSRCQPGDFLSPSAFRLLPLKAPPVAVGPTSVDVPSRQQGRQQGHEGEEAGGPPTADSFPNIDLADMRRLFDRYYSLSTKPEELSGDQRRLPPSLEVCNHMLLAYAVSGDEHGMFSFAEQVAASTHIARLDLHSYDALIVGCGVAGNIPAALGMLEIMKSHHLHDQHHHHFGRRGSSEGQPQGPSMESLTHFVDACARHGHVTDAVRVWDHMRIHQKWVPDWRMFAAMLRLYLNVGQVHQAYALLSEVPRQFSLPPTVGVCAVFVRYFAELGLNPQHTAGDILKLCEDAQALQHSLSLQSDSHLPSRRARAGFAAFTARVHDLYVDEIRHTFEIRAAQRARSLRRRQEVTRRRIDGLVDDLYDGMHLDEYVR